MKEEKYLEKIENDVQERLYDLLIMHIYAVHEKVRKGGPNVGELVSLLERALAQLESKVTKFNKLPYYRYMLIICNKILIYESRQDIKDKKKKIIEDFTRSEEDQGDLIPLNYQMNEIRITYDASYLSYLMTKFVKEGLWEKALYSLIAVSLIEPDNSDIDWCYSEIKKNMGDSRPPEPDFERPRGMVLALDSNAVISHIFHDVGDYRIKSEKAFDLEKLGNDNRFLVTSSVREEVHRHIEYKMVEIRKFCKENPRFEANEIQGALLKRLDTLYAKYGAEMEPCYEGIREMYLEYLNVLEEILLQKIRGKFVSHKLRKLAQRPGMLPEDGDIRLLAECSGKDIGILSKDKDLTCFAGEIWERFGVKVYKEI